MIYSKYRISILKEERNGPGKIPDTDGADVLLRSRKLLCRLLGGDPLGNHGIGVLHAICALDLIGPVLVDAFPRPVASWSQVWACWRPWAYCPVLAELLLRSMRSMERILLLKSEKLVKASFNIDIRYLEYIIDIRYCQSLYTAAARPVGVLNFWWKKGEGGCKSILLISRPQPP